MKTIDLHFQGHSRVIATAVLAGPSGVALVDPGPTSTLAALESGLQAFGHELREVKTLLLTHIHLDHAGSSGTLAARLPGVVVYVHERGAPHMAAPGKLLDSASRLYGDKMEQLWGEVLPVPAERLRVLKGGERLDLADGVGVISGHGDDVVPACAGPLQRFAEGVERAGVGLFGIGLARCEVGRNSRHVDDTVGDDRVSPANLLLHLSLPVTGLYATTVLMQIPLWGTLSKLAWWPGHSGWRILQRLGWPEPGFIVTSLAAAAVVSGLIAFSAGRTLTKRWVARPVDRKGVAPDV